MNGKRFRVDPYGWRVYVYSDREKWARATARAKFGTLKNRREESADCAGISSIDPNTQRAYMGVFRLPFDTVAHEASHVSTAILRNAGTRIVEATDETLAYLTGFIAGKCHEAIK